MEWQVPSGGVCGNEGGGLTRGADGQEALAWLEVSRPDLMVVGGSVAGVGAVEPLCRVLEGSGVPLRVVATPAEQEVLRRQGVRPESFLARPLSLGTLVGRKLLQLHLAPFRFEVVTACDGRAALDVALRAGRTSSSRTC